ncbi:hypothetical protein DFJ73DRAFT_135534 [Zopfochytrium polystomum]|nr:hypothetical protein DFJ73DRAFT_135534 [Zopfochytrium polystomum]
MPPPAVFAGGPGPVPLAGATSTSFPLAAAAVDGAPPPYIAVRQQPRQRKPVDSGESVVPKYMVTAALPTAHAKSKRKPQPKSYDIPRLLIQVVEVRVKTTTNALHAHFTLQMGSKKIWSTPVLLEKESRQGLGLVAVPREAFLFDISPDLDLSDLNVPILLTLVDGVPPPIEQRIAAHQASADCAHRRQPSPTPSARSGFSTNTVNSVKSVFNRFLKGGSNNGSGLPRSTTSTSGLCDAGSGVAAAAAESAEADVERSRSGTGKWLASALGRPLAKMGVKGGATPKRATGAAAGGAVGSAVIGEVAFGVPRDLRDSEKSTKCIKLYPTGTGRAASTRKGQAMVETAQVVFQIGLIWDEQFPPPEPVVEHSDYLNFQVNSKSGAIWKRYWVVLKDACLDIYNFEYKESKPAISALELSDNLIEVSHADPEVVCAPHCTQLRFVDLERVPPSGPDQLEGDEASVWRQSILDPEYQLAFVTADSKEQMLEWQTVLTMHARKRS